MTSWFIFKKNYNLFEFVRKLLTKFTHIFMDFSQKWSVLNLWKALECGTYTFVTPDTFNYIESGLSLKVSSECNADFAVKDEDSCEMYGECGWCNKHLEWLVWFGATKFVVQTKMELSKLVSTVHNAAVELMVLKTSTMCPQQTIVYFAVLEHYMSNLRSNFTVRQFIWKTLKL